MKTKLFVSVALVLAVGLAGCAKVPAEKVTAAETALSAAMSAEAQIYAPQAVAAARDSLNAAKAEIEAQNKSFVLMRRYGKATALLTAAETAATNAAQEATTRKAQVRANVETLMTNATAAVDSVATLLAKAPVGKDNRADVELMKADLEAMRTSLTDIRGLYDQGAYMDAQTKAEALMEQLNRMAAEIEAAKAAKAMKK